LKNIQKVLRNTRYSLFLSLAFTVGITFIYPVGGMIFAAILVLIVFPAFWLSRHRHIYAMVGALFFLTILRPLPDISAVYDRLLDVLWLILVVAICAYWIRTTRQKLRFWPASYWLLAGTLVVILSLPIGALLGQPVILRDFFELYRGLYYFLVLLIATRVSWGDEKLSSFFYKPFLIALFFVFVISIIQGLGIWGKSFVSAMYVPRYAESFFGMFSNPIGTGSGFFFLINSGTFANPNWYGVSLGIVIPFLMAGLFLRNSRLLKISIFVAVIVAFTMIIIAGSRAGFAMGTISVFGYFFLWLYDILKRPSVTHDSISSVGKWVPMVLLIGLVALLVIAAVFRGDRYHGTFITFGSIALNQINIEMPFISEPKEEGSISIQTDINHIITMLLDDPLSKDTGKGDTGKGDTGKGDTGKGDTGKVPVDPSPLLTSELERAMERLRNLSGSSLIPEIKQVIKTLEEKSGIPRFDVAITSLRGILLTLESQSAVVPQEPKSESFSEALGTIKVGKYHNDSAARKYYTSKRLIKEVMERSPIIGLGPSKSVGNVLGDNQYSVTIYRYGIVGTLVWFGFWVVLMWHALRLWRHAETPIQAALLRAVLATIPPFLLACFAGAFFDARQIATIYLLLIGIALSCASKRDTETTASNIR